MQRSFFASQQQCKLSTENGMLVVETPYNPQLIQMVKSLPYTERRYEPARKIWFVDPKHGQLLVNWIDQFYGEVVSLPSVSNLNAKPVMKLLEVRYIGICKTRDDGSSSAFGMVGNEWPVIFPEEVLRNWFDSGPVQPTAISTLYQVLGTHKAATNDEIKTAYRRMAKQWHPDVCKEQDAQEVFMRIQEAYALLIDPNKRAKYDAGLTLQAIFESRENQQEKFAKSLPVNNYRSPLRCGLIMFEGTEKLGRIHVSKILGWEDIVDSMGRTLVVSWQFGDNEPVENWV